MRVHVSSLCCFLLISLSSVYEQKDSVNPIPYKEGFLRVQDGFRLAYKVIGTGSDVLIIPGGHSSLMTDFSSLAKGRKLVMYDQRGRGHSDAVEDLSHIGIDYEVHDPEAIRQHVRAERVSLLGCSYLGGIVALYALKCGRRKLMLNRVFMLSQAPDPAC